MFQGEIKAYLDELKEKKKAKEWERKEWERDKGRERSRFRDLGRGSLARYKK